MKPEKMYFKDTNSETCYDLETHLNDAEADGLEEVTLMEADPDNSNPDYVWCSLDGCLAERSDCKKSFCTGYSSKSGRGACKHRGKLYTHGKEITFKVNDKTF